MSRQYATPPLREVVCEIRFEEDGHWDGAVPGLIYAAMRDEFPRRLPVENPIPPTAQTPASPSPLPQGLPRLELRVGPSEGLRFWRSTDESGYFLVAPYRLAVCHFPPYPSWQRLSETVGKGFLSYRDVLKPTKVQRIGLRYINVVDLRQSEASLEEFFEFYPFLGDNIPQELSGFHCQAQIPFEDRRDVLILQLWRVPRLEGESMAVSLDLDYFLAQPDRFELAQTMEWLEAGHKNIQSVFEGCLKDSARMLFQ